MRSAIVITGFLLLEVLLLVVGNAGLSSSVPSFIAIGYLSIACMIAAPFYAAKRLNQYRFDQYRRK